MTLKMNQSFMFGEKQIQNKYSNAAQQLQKMFSRQRKPIVKELKTKNQLPDFSFGFKQNQNKKSQNQHQVQTKNKVQLSRIRSCQNIIKMPQIKISPNVEIQNKLNFNKKCPVKKYQASVDFLEWYKVKQQKNVLRISEKIKNSFHASKIKSNKIIVLNQQTQSDQKSNNEQTVQKKKYFVAKTVSSITRSKNPEVFIFQNLNFLQNKENPQQIIKVYGIIKSHGIFGKSIMNFFKQLFLSELKKKLKNQEINQKLLKKTVNQVFCKQCIQSQSQMRFSGITFTIIFLYKSSLFTLNIGNHKAIIGEQLQVTQKENDWNFKVITKIHDLSRQSQKNRILRNEGSIKEFNVGNKKKYSIISLRNNQSHELSLSRSFGDLQLAEFGVISVPQTEIFELRKSTKIVFIGDEKLYQFFNQKELMDMLFYNYDKQISVEKCSRRLINQFTKLMLSQSIQKSCLNFMLIFLY